MRIKPFFQPIFIEDKHKTALIYYSIRKLIYLFIYYNLWIKKPKDEL